MRYVLKRLTDGQFMRDYGRYSNGQRWTTNISDARVFNRRCDATQSGHGYHDHRHLIRIIPVVFKEVV